MDLGGPTSGPEEVVAANVYHRAFALGPLNRSWPLSDVEARLTINGEVRASSAAEQDIADLVCSVAALLGGMGERLQAGDRMIMGSIVQVPLAPGDQVIAELGALGRVQLTVEL